MYQYNIRKNSINNSIKLLQSISLQRLQWSQIGEDIYNKEKDANNKDNNNISASTPTSATTPTTAAGNDATDTATDTATTATHTTATATATTTPTNTNDDDDDDTSNTNTTNNYNSFHMIQKDGKHKTAADVLSMPNITLTQIITIINQLGKNNNNVELSQFNVSNLVYDTVEATCKYANYLTRQSDEMSRYKRNNFISIPNDILYTHSIFPSFSSEELEKLSFHRPVTIHEASQIQGVTPHSLVYLQNYITKRKRSTARTAASNVTASVGVESE